MTHLLPKELKLSHSWVEYSGKEGPSSVPVHFLSRQPEVEPGGSISCWASREKVVMEANNAEGWIHTARNASPAVRRRWDRGRTGFRHKRNKLHQPNNMQWLFKKKSQFFQGMGAFQMWCVLSKYIFSLCTRSHWCEEGMTSGCAVELLRRSGITFGGGWVWPPGPLLWCHASNPPTPGRCNYPWTSAICRRSWNQSPNGHQSPLPR